MGTRVVRRSGIGVGGGDASSFQVPDVVREHRRGEIGESPAVSSSTTCAYATTSGFDLYYVDVSNATGNHESRNHPVRVPTKAGEPVRG